MRNKAQRAATQPRVVGMGLIALDAVMKRESSSPHCYYAGGTCGNVLTILAYLGWEATPVARFGSDPIAQQILKDLKRWGVRTDYCHLEPAARAPVILERITTDAAGNGMHRFSVTCPECGAWFPGFRPVPAKAVEAVLDGLAKTQVFFFDRPSRSALTVAQACREKGACVYFEPASVGDPKLFREAVDLAHIVKYSCDRLSDLRDLKQLTVPLLEIGTLGTAGLRFRTRLARHNSADWCRLPGFPVHSVKDAAGSGDWLTAVLLNSLAREGLACLELASFDDVLSALSLAQAAAAWNCAFEAARGGMASTTKEDFWAAAREIEAGSPQLLQGGNKQQGMSRAPAVGLCPACSSKRVHKQRGKAASKRRK